ncbi:MAG: hypothetical protein AAFU61_02455 [Pseudomonadota bacterium]
MTDTVVNLGAADRIVDVVGAGGAVVLSDADASVDGEQTSPSLKRILPSDLPAATETVAGILSTALFARSGLLTTVTPEEHGGLGDGAADDQTPMEQALAALAAAGGGVLLLQRHYRLGAGGLVVPSNVIVLSRGAEITCDATGVDVFVVDGTSARKSDVSFIGPLRVTLADAGDGDPSAGYVLSCRRVSRVSLRDVTVVRGKLIRTWLRSDFTTRDVDGVTIPDVTAATETSMAAELNFDVRVEACSVEGEDTVTNAAGAGAAVMLGWVERFHVTDLTARTVYHAVLWWGGDHDQDRDDIAADWAREGAVTGCVVRGAASGAVWGSCFRDVETSANKVLVSALGNRVGPRRLHLLDHGLDYTNPAMTDIACRAVAEKARSGGGGEIILPRGVIPYNTPLVFYEALNQAGGQPGTVRVIGAGEGKDGTVFRAVADVAGDIIALDGLTTNFNPFVKLVEFHNFAVEGSPDSGVTRYKADAAFKFNDASRVLMDRVRVSNIDAIPLWGRRLWDSQFVDLYLDGCGRAPHMTLSSVSGTFSAYEVLTGGTSGAKATTGPDGGTTLLEVSDVEGFQIGETVTGGTSGATATLDAVDAGAPNILLEAVNPSDTDQQSNADRFDRLHIENHRGIGVQLLHEVRSIIFDQPKFHHPQGRIPPYGIPHFMVDRRNASTFAPYEVVLQTPQMATCAGSHITLRNTGGAANQGIIGFQLLGGRLASAEHWAVEILAAQSATIGGGAVLINNNVDTNYGDIGVDPRASGVVIDAINLLTSPTGGAVKFDPLNQVSAAASFRPEHNEIAAGAISYFGGFVMRIRAEDWVEGSPNVDSLTTINGGEDGDVIMIAAQKPGSGNGFDAITIEHGAGNIELTGGTDRSLTEHPIQLYKHAAAGVWRDFAA